MNKIFIATLCVFCICTYLVVDARKIQTRTFLHELASSSGRNFRSKRAARGRCVELSPCRCRAKRTVACTKTDCLQQLPSISMSQRRGEEILNIIVTRQGNFTRINERDFQKLPNLRSIRLFNNGISDVHSNAFYWTKKLEVLDLHRNNLATFPSAIQDLRNLRRLNLGKNNIKTLPLNAFRHNRKLEYLYLRRNGMESIPGYLPKGLVKLSVGGNSLTSVNDISYLSHLKFLYLDDNQLTRIDSQDLPRTLRVLKLCKNKLRFGKAFAFNDLVDLRRLYLAGNPEIGQIDRSTFFDGASALRLLDVRHCGITNIDQSAFTCLPRLQTVELGNNNLTSYSKMWFAHNLLLSRLTLSGNPWTCNCDMKTNLDQLSEAVSDQLRRRRRKRIAKHIRTRFENDFKNITCTKLSSELNQLLRNSPIQHLSSIEIDMCGSTSASWHFNPPVCQLDTDINAHSSTTLTDKPPTTTTTTTTTRKTTTTTTTATPTTTTRTTTRTTTTRATTPTTTTRTTTPTTTTRTTTPTTTTRTTTPTTTTRTTTPTTTTRTTTPTTTTRTTTPTTTTTSTTTTTTSAQPPSNEVVRICTPSGDCAFPFEYGGETYTNSCVYRLFGGNWCYTTDSWDQWATCQECTD